MSFEIVYKEWVRSGGRIRYGYVPWDSEIFGFSFYQLILLEDAQGSTKTLQELLDFLLEQSGGKCLVFTKLAPWDVGIIQELVQQGFYQVETIVEPYRNLKSYEPNRRFERLQLRPAKETDKQKLLEMAYRAFAMDRYHLDPNLSSEKANIRYQNWLNNGMQHGDPIYVYEDTTRGDLIGFFHLREKTKEVVDLSLAAIDPDYQNGGLGALMYGECLTECKRLGYNQAITRISVSNIAVLNIYAHLGFLFRHPQSTWHWYADR